jgi:hypothetical protein
MKVVMAVLSLLACATLACAQNPDPSKWMCRNVSESGGFVYQGETVFGPQACRPIQQMAAAEPKHDVATPAVAATSETSAAATADQPQVAQNPSKAFLLQDGTPVHLVLSENLSSADAVTGQTVEFEVVDDVVVDGLLVIPHGSTAWATVTDAEHKKRMGRAGKLDLNIDKVRLAGRNGCDVVSGLACCAAFPAHAREGRYDSQGNERFRVRSGRYNFGRGEISETTRGFQIKFSVSVTEVKGLGSEDPSYIKPLARLKKVRA